MQTQFYLFRRGRTYYCEDRQTGQQTSLRTKDRSEAQRLVDARNEAARQPLLNLAMAKTYLAAHDPKLITRTWADVMVRFCQRDQPATRLRHERALRTRAMKFLKDKLLVETTADDLFHTMNLGANSTVAFLQTMHNDALGMGWLPMPILPRKLWPRPKKKVRRAITEAEHQRLLANVAETEWRLYLQMLWFTGASQTDGANFSSANVDWPNRVFTYHRRKLMGRNLPPAGLAIGTGLETLLKQLPATGDFFPKLKQMDDRSRSCFFWKLGQRLEIAGISLHSYRYSWAERAKVAGIPQRWAQAALGHNSKAVHDAYARNALVICPPIDAEMDFANRWSAT
jgi:integrase